MTPYQYGANNPIKFIDINGDSIYIFHRNEKILYVNGELFFAGTGKEYDGKAYNNKGVLKGFVKSVKDALDAIASGGEAGQELVNYFSGMGKDIQIEKSTGGNSEKGGKIKWNANSKLSDIPNNDGTDGRPSFIGLAHEMGHSWDRSENKDKNFTLWYNAENKDKVSSSEKVATWWENRIRSENGIGLRTHYSYINSGNGNKGENKGHLLISGTSYSSQINSLGMPRITTLGFRNVFIPYKY